MTSSSSRSVLIPWSLALVPSLVLVGQHLVRTWGNPLGLVRIVRLARTLEKAADRGDVEALVSLFQQGAEHRGLTTGRLIRGREALAQTFTEEFRTEGDPAGPVNRSGRESG